MTDLTADALAEIARAHEQNDLVTQHHAIPDLLAALTAKNKEIARLRSGVERDHVYRKAVHVALDIYQLPMSQWNVPALIRSLREEHGLARQQVEELATLLRDCVGFLRSDDVYDPGPTCEAADSVLACIERP